MRTKWTLLFLDYMFAHLCRWGVGITMYIHCYTPTPPSSHTHTRIPITYTYTPTHTIPLLVCRVWRQKRTRNKRACLLHVSVYVRHVSVPCVCMHLTRACVRVRMRAVYASCICMCVEPRVDEGWGNTVTSMRKHIKEKKEFH